MNFGINFTHQEEDPGTSWTYPPTQWQMKGWRLGFPNLKMFHTSGGDERLHPGRGGRHTQVIYDQFLENARGPRPPKPPSKFPPGLQGMIKHHDGLIWRPYCGLGGGLLAP